MPPSPSRRPRAQGPAARSAPSAGAGLSGAANHRLDPGAVAAVEERVAPSARREQLAELARELCVAAAARGDEGLALRALLQLARGVEQLPEQGPAGRVGGIQAAPRYGGRDAAASSIDGGAVALPDQTAPAAAGLVSATSVRSSQSSSGGSTLSGARAQLKWRRQGGSAATPVTVASSARRTAVFASSAASAAGGATGSPAMAIASSGRSSARSADS